MLANKISNEYTAIVPLFYIDEEVFENGSEIYLSIDAENAYDKFNKGCFSIDLKAGTETIRIYEQVCDMDQDPLEAADELLHDWAVKLHNKIVCTRKNTIKWSQFNDSKLASFFCGWIGDPAGNGFPCSFEIRAKIRNVGDEYYPCYKLQISLYSDNVWIDFKYRKDFESNRAAIAEGNLIIRRMKDELAANIKFLTD